jgi:hypothetical protein
MINNTPTQTLPLEGEGLGGGENVNNLMLRVVKRKRYAKQSQYGMIICCRER